jgi:hypothetical protein
MSLAVSDDAATERGAEPLVEVIRAHKAASGLTRSADYQDLVRGRPDLDARLQAIAQRIDRGEEPTLTLDEERQVVAHLGPVANNLSFDLLLAALRVHDAGIRKSAKINLLRPSFRPFVQGAAERLRPLLPDYPASDESCELLGLLEPSGALRADLVSQKTTPWHVRARLGDGVAETQLLEHFAQASPFARGRLAPKLFYADTPRAWEAFAKALGSTRSFVDYRGQERSEAFELIQAYGTYFDAPLFKPAAYQGLLYMRGEEFATKAEGYLRQISREIERAHGVSVQVGGDFFVRNEVPLHIIDVVE